MMPINAHVKSAAAAASSCRLSPARSPAAKCRIPLARPHRPCYASSLEKTTAPSLPPSPALSPAPSYINNPSREAALEALPTVPAGMGKKERRQWIMNETCSFLKSDLEKIFATGEITPYRYSPSITFEDPITATSDLNAYVIYMKLLKTIFAIDFDLHSIEVTGEDEVSARWSMSLGFWLLPWKPTLDFTGTTHYTVDPDSGMILAHVDIWDALKHNRFLSLEGVQHVMKMFVDVQMAPQIKTHKHKVLKKYRDYELRQYSSYLVAQIAMPLGSGPSSGTGFNELTSYISGTNKEGARMAMTAPVLSVVPPGMQQSSTLQFVMEHRFSSTQQLPNPTDTRIELKMEPGGFYAAARFSGWPLDWEVVAAERELRTWLERDGYKSKDGYLLARHNEPDVPPFLRVNEVIIELDDFKWP